MIANCSNAGGDILRINDQAENLTAYLSGSNVVLRWDDYDAIIPVGVSGMFLEFDAAGNAVDSRKLYYDDQAKTVLIGDQVIIASTELAANQLVAASMPMASTIESNVLGMG